MFNITSVLQESIKGAWNKGGVAVWKFISKGVDFLVLESNWDAVCCNYNS